MRSPPHAKSVVGVFQPRPAAKRRASQAALALFNSNVTPRCRKSGGSLTRTRTRTCGSGLLLYALYASPRQRQGLFNRDHAFTLLLDDLVTKHYLDSNTSELSAEEMEVFSFYGGVVTFMIILSLTIWILMNFGY